MAIGVGQEVPALLVVEDDHQQREFLVQNLGADRFSVIEAGSCEEALGLLRTAAPDAALVDVMLPGASGLDLVSAIRDGGADDPWDAGMPVMLLSARAEPLDAVRGIERGADDYVVKPYYYPEVVARLGAMIRRARGVTMTEVIRVGPLVVDRHARRALLNGRVLSLSAKEFALLAMLVKAPRRVFTKQELLRDVWGFRSPGRTRTVDSHASRLRRKLAAAGGGERYVANVWGVGYRLLPDDA
jgi:DNA-binding response OmpR family regulator